MVQNCATWINVKPRYQHSPSEPPGINEPVETCLMVHKTINKELEKKASELNSTKSKWKDVLYFKHMIHNDTLGPTK